MRSEAQAQPEGQTTSLKGSTHGLPKLMTEIIAQQLNKATVIYCDYKQQYMTWAYSSAG
jgi:hypothetical protein